MGPIVHGNWTLKSHPKWYHTTEKSGVYLKTGMTRLCCLWVVDQKRLERWLHGNRITISWQEVRRSLTLMTRQCSDVAGGPHALALQTGSGQPSGSLLKSPKLLFRPRGALPSCPRQLALLLHVQSSFPVPLIPPRKWVLFIALLYCTVSFPAKCLDLLCSEQRTIVNRNDRSFSKKPGLCF